jgi:DNA-binding NarL/FixJ family response regulator
VILDVQLRVGHGLNVLRKLNTLLPGSMPAVIMLTDFAIADFGRHAATYGARHFLDKSTGMKQLQTILRLLAFRPSTAA